jgi:hypothetical protein
MPEGNNRARSITDGRDQPYRKVPQFSAHLLGDGYGYFAGVADLNSKFAETVNSHDAHEGGDLHG